MKLKKLYKGNNWIWTGVVMGVVMTVILYAVRLLQVNIIESNYFEEIPLLMIVGCIMAYMGKRSVEKKPNYQSDPK